MKSSQTLGVGASKVYLLVTLNSNAINNFAKQKSCSFAFHTIACRDDDLNVVGILTRK